MVRKIKHMATAYQKLKKENAKLKQDIYNLIRNSETPETKILKHKYEIMFQISDVVWAGDTLTQINKFSGIMPQIITNE
jgi:hypothetical protein